MHKLSMQATAELQLQSSFFFGEDRKGERNMEETDKSRDTDTLNCETQNLS